MDEDVVTRIEKSRTRYKSGFLIFSLLFLTGLATLAVIYALPGLWLFFAGLVFVCISASCFALLNYFYKRSGKKHLMHDMGAAAGMNYARKGAFKINDIHHHGLIPQYDQAQIEDGFSAQDGYYPISFQEAYLARHEYDEKTKNTSHIPVFRGMVIRIGLKKPLEFHTLILPNKFLKPSAEAGHIPWNSGFEPVKIVDPTFSKAYKVVSTNQIESRVLFDPLFIERFIELGAHLEADWLEASFKDQELLIMARFKHNFFELGTFFRPVTQESIDKIEDEIRYILSITDILKHNTYFERKKG